MKNIIKILVFATIFFGVIACGLFGLSRLKVDDFKKSAIILLVDSSASNNKNLASEKMAIRQLCSMLDPEDHIKILRVSEDSYIIFEGSPQSGSEIRKAMEKFTQLDNKEYGTAYGLALKKAFNHAITMKSQGYIPAIVVIGDLENEGETSKQVNWDSLPSEVANLKAKVPEISMMFLWATPQKLDMVKDKLSPVLGEDKLITGNEVTVNKSLRLFLKSIGR